MRYQITINKELRTIQVEDTLENDIYRGRFDDKGNVIADTRLDLSMLTKSLFKQTGSTKVQMF